MIISNLIKGIGYIVVGTILLLFALGVHRFSPIVTILSIGLILYGVLKTNYYQKVVDVINKK